MSPPPTAVHAACLAWVYLTIANGANGQETPAPPSLLVEQPPAAETWQQWYGAPMLAMDAASMGFVVGGADLVANNLTLCFLACRPDPGRTQAANGGVAMFLTGGAGFVLGAPIDHLVHGEGETAVKSLIVRLLLPPAALLSGMGLATLACGNDQGCGAAIPLTLVGASMVGTALVDDLIGAHRAAPAETAGRIHLVPTVSVGRSSAIGLAAVF